MRIVALAVLLGGIVVFWGWIASEAGAQGGTRRPSEPPPLDLPIRGIGDDDDGVDSPGLVSFYDTVFEGNAFFWVLDRSGSMGWNGEIDILKAETTQAIQQLSRATDFGIVFFSSSTLVWSNVPQLALPMNKSEAIAFVNAQTAEGWTCLEDAVVTALGISNLSSKADKKILILGDGSPICNGVDTSFQVLTSVAAANWQNTTIDTIYISSDAEGIGFMEELATANGGRCVVVSD